MAHHPLTWPINSYFVPAGTTAMIRISPTFFYATNGVLSLEPEERNCLVAVFSILTISEFRIKPRCFSCRTK